MNRTIELATLIGEYVSELGMREKIEPEDMAKALTAAAGKILFLAGPMVMAIKLSTNEGPFTVRIEIDRLASRGDA